MPSPRVALLFVTLALSATAAQAGVYKCKGPGGKVIYSNEPCEAVGAQQEKKLSKATLQPNQMRMRPRPPQGDGSAPQFGSGSGFQGSAPQGGAGDPRKSK